MSGESGGIQRCKMGRVRRDHKYCEHNSEQRVKEDIRMNAADATIYSLASEVKCEGKIVRYAPVG